ncbi:MAG: metallophosphoesterase [Actinomycetota bacterium]|nr:metallophosphoesterase [Actinomycetota bacterium]
MSTLVVSDLHIGAHTRADVARRRELRAPLIEAIAHADELVLLGDVVELRDGPLASALVSAREFFEEVGAALEGRRVVIAPGNHDYQLIAPWLEVRRAHGGPMGLEERVKPVDASPAAAQVAAWLGDAELELAYPGLWLRPDVYATHGHYLDLHISVPSFERLGARVVDRMVRGAESALRTPDDYEATLSPIYALLNEVAQVAPDRGTGGSGASERAWRMLAGDGRRRVPLPMQLALWGAWPLAIAGLKRAGLGPLSADLSGPSLRRAAVVAMGEVIERLGVQAEHVIFGHTHRAGPFTLRDDAADWRTAGGTSLFNTGCWLYSPTFLTATPNESPYWPGVCVHVDDQGPPRLERLLRYQTHADLRPA